MSVPLHLHQLHKQYGSVQAVQNVSLQLREGEIFGFLGPNGAGKTTTIRSIMDYIRPTSGSISIFGLDSVSDSIQAKTYVGHFAGDGQLYPQMTGYQLLRYLARFRNTYDTSFIEHLRERLDVSLSTPITDLSRGNRQKVGLIQAFMHRPPLVILDEPTAGLDPLVKNTFYTLIDELQQEGTTFFISSHDLAEVQKICDRVGFIRNGTLIETNELEDIIRLRVRHYTVTFAEPPQPQPFQNLEAVSEVSIQDNRLRAVVSGEVTEFLHKVSEYTPLDLEEHTMSVEDIFLTYYETT